MRRVATIEVGPYLTACRHWCLTLGAWQVHAALFATAAVVLTLANVAFAPQRLWFWQPLAVWVLLLAVHGAAALWSAGIVGARRDPARADAADADATIPFERAITPAIVAPIPVDPGAAPQPAPRPSWPMPMAPAGPVRAADPAPAAEDRVTATGWARRAIIDRPAARSMPTANGGEQPMPDAWLATWPGAAKSAHPRDELLPEEVLALWRVASAPGNPAAKRASDPDSATVAPRADAPGNDPPAVRAPGIAAAPTVVADAAASRATGSPPVEPMEFGWG